MKFTEVFFNEFKNAVKEYYIGRIVYNGMKLPNDNLEEFDTFDCYSIEQYLSFLNNLPSDKYQEVSKTIWSYLLYIDVQNDLIKKQNKLIFNNRGNGEPNKIINSDLKTLIKSKAVFEKMFQSGLLTKGKQWMGSRENFDNIFRINRLSYGTSEDYQNKKDYDINAFFEILNLLINDLETKEFNFVSENVYYPYSKTTKESLNNYLLEICKSNKIKDYRNSVREFIEQILIN